MIVDYLRSATRLRLAAMVTRRTTSGWLLVLLALGCGACLMTTDLDRLQNARPMADGGEPVVTDGAAIVDAGVDAPPPGTVVFSESFEGAGPTGCNPYHPWQGTAMAGSPAYEGDKACLVCRGQPGTGAFTLDGIFLPSAPKIGQRYVGEAWVRAPAEGPAAPSVIVTLRLEDSTNSELVGRGSPEISIDATWRKVTVDFTPSQSAPILNMYVASTAPNGACFLIDQASIRTLP